MKHSRVMNAIILVILLLSSTPVRGQDTAGSQQYLPFIVSGQSSTSAHDHTPPEQRIQTTGVTFTVTKFTDSADGVCDADCSLREAVSVANQMPGADTIVLTGGTYQLTIPPVLDDQNLPIDDENNAISDLDIADDLTIVGVSAETTKITSAMHQRVFKVQAGATAKFSQITITGGKTPLYGGGIFNAGDLSLDNVQVVANEAIFSAGQDGGTGNGGGIYNLGKLALLDTTVAHNGAYDYGGGLYNAGELTLGNVQITGNRDGGFDSRGHGGGIYNKGSLAIHTSQITDNGAIVMGSGDGNGGGIDNEEGGVLQVYNSFIQGNLSRSAEGLSSGGGVANRGKALIWGSTVAYNRTQGGGGGITNSSGDLLVVNSTISSNAQEFAGGKVDGIANGGTLTLLNVTISGNTGGGVHNRGTMQVGNTVIVGDARNDNDTLTCTNEGTFTSLGHNLFDSQGACPHNGTADQVVDHAIVFTRVLGPLLNDGSTLPIHALLRGSAAVDAGDDAICAGAEVGGVDQRGVARPQGAHCDIGAYEGVAENIFSPTKFADSFDGVCDADCSLREAISAANQDPGADIIPLAAGVYQLTIAPELDYYGAPREDENNAIGDLDIADDLNLIGAGAETTTIESAMHQRVFKVLSGAKTQFSHFTITGGATSYDEDGGGLFNAGALTMTNVRMVDIKIGNSDAASGNGGSIYTIGTLALFDSTIANNTAYADGGGIFNTGVMTMTNVQVTGNQAGGYDGGGHGGGLYNTGELTIYRSQITQNAASAFGTAAGTGGGISNDGVLRVYESVIQDNTASSGESQARGGGVSNRGDALISGSTVTANMAELGGGIALFGGNVTVVNSSINGNQGSIGGGIWNSGGASLTLRNSTISQNIVSGDGGGLYSDSADSHVTLQNSTISGNQSSNGGSGGGLWNSGGSTMTLINSTVSGNVSTGNGGGINNTRSAGLFTILNSTITDNQAAWSGGGVWNDENSTLLYHNTIIAGNTAAQSGPDCQNEAILTSQGHNLVGNSTGCDSSAPSDLTVAPNAVFLHLIQPLKSNEPGQTATHALLPGSPAIDGGDDTVCPTTDQRGVTRPQGAHCDIGAYEGVRSGLVSWWQAEGDATDVLGANDGSLQNQAGFAPGFAGQAFALDGVDDWVMVPDTPTLNLGARDFTVALWVNFATLTNEQVLIEKFVDTYNENGVPLTGWSLTKMPDQFIRLVGPLDGDASIFDTAPLNIPTDRWLYVALTREGNSFALYWDGQWVGGANKPINLDSESTLKLGHRGNPTDTPGSANDRNFYLHGCVDEVQIWDHALSGEEIATTAALARDEVCMTTPTTPGYLFVSSSSSGKADNVQFRDEDIVAYDFATNAWQMVFDGSDVGVTKDIDAFAFRPDGSLLLSFNAPTNVPGLGKVDDSDIVQFSPTQLGSDTAGSFIRYLRGADVGLTTDGEDIDAIGFSPDDQLVVSTIGDFHTPTLAGKDEDLIRLDDAGSGAWIMFLDGSTVGLANEDVNGFWLDTATGERYLTVKDSFAFSDGQATVQIDSDDIFVCTPTQAGCTYHRFWDSDSHDYGSENLDSLGLGVLPARLVVGGQGRDGATSTPEETATDDDIDDINLEELTNRLFLPLVQQ